MSSTALGLTTILKCLSVAEAEIQLSANNWKGSPDADPDFRWFLANQASWRSGLEYFNPEDLKGFATRDFQKVLAKMAEWKMKVDPPAESAAEDCIYAISKLLEMVNWKVKGKPISRPGMYPEFSLGNFVRFWSHDFSDEPLVSITTENDDTVWVTRQTQEISGLSLVHRIADIVASAKPWQGDTYTEVHIPCVKVEIKPSLDWLVRTMINEGWFVSDAKQLVRFGMNEQGFVVLEETAMSVSFEACVSESLPYIVSPNGEGFLFGRTRKGVRFPISAFHLTSEAFQDPGNLEDVVK
jgi:hypothetical protein